MNKSLLVAAAAVALSMAAPFAGAQSSNSTSGGGAGGTGGAAMGGTAQGGTAMNSNTTSGVANASGGTGQGGGGGSAQGGGGGSAQGGAASAQGGAAAAQGGNVGTVSTGGSQASLGDVSVNFNQASNPLGKDGLGVGVDPNTGHIMTDSTIKYSGSYKLKNTPDVSIGGPASGPCNGISAGIGFSMAGLGIGANTSTVDENCTARETARIAAMLGRMDIANAVLENLPAVQAAMKAKAERTAMEQRSRPEALSPTPATTAPLRDDAAIKSMREAAAKAQRDLDQALREAALKEQQNQAQEALARQATMNKVNDTLKFTDATTQHDEKTPQEVMAEEATAKLNQPVAVQQVAAKKQDPLPMPVTTTPLPPQPQISAMVQPMTSVKSEAPKAQMTDARSEKVSTMAPEDRAKAAKAAMNIQ